jgi:pyruvate/2-oxoglutarate dehydrogenase complex dihydrolipoamide acyltransferase (E2) component
LTTTINYGPIEPDGSVDVRIVYDHRVLDGGTVARALDHLERILGCEILAELRYLQAVDAA